MEYAEQIQRLNAMLLEEMPEYRPQARDFPRDTAGQRRLLRSLMNVRPPMPLDPEFRFAPQDSAQAPHFSFIKANSSLSVKWFSMLVMSTTLASSGGYKNSRCHR